jgi:hypothetical protein
MRGLALVLWGLGVVGSFYWGKATSPALEGTYVLSADRWKQGRAPYQDLQAPADPITLWIFREVPAYGMVYLLFWKAIGGLLLVGFVLRRPLREAPPTPWHWIMVGLIGGLYQVLPWNAPIEVGETAYGLALWLGESARRPFLQGILLSVLLLWHPVVVWALVFWLYRRWENQEGQAALYHLLGLLWGVLALLALSKTLWGSAALYAYLLNYTLLLWQVGTPDKGLWLLNGASLLILVLFSGEMGRVPYRERVLYRRNLWAALSTLGWGGRAFPGLTLFTVRPRSPTLKLLQLLLGLSYLGYGTFAFLRHPSPQISLSLAPNSCFWGMPPTYLTLQGHYGCDLTTPHAWSSAKVDWEELYRKLHQPDWIYDAEGYMARFRYYLPRKLAPYEAVDTTLFGFLRLYQRKSKDTLPWIRAHPPAKPQSQPN